MYVTTIELVSKDVEIFLRYQPIFLPLRIGMQELCRKNLGILIADIILELF